METRPVALPRFDLGAAPAPAAMDVRLRALERCLRISAGTEDLTVSRDGDRAVRVRAPSDRIDDAQDALAIMDALDPKTFAEPNLFTGLEPSRRTVSLSVSDFDTARLLYAMGAATGWPVIVDEAARGPLTFQLQEVPWDVAVQTRLQPAYRRRRVRRSARPAAACEGVIETSDGARGAVPPPYSGQSFTPTDFHADDLYHVLGLLADASGLNVVVPPGIRGGGLTFHMTDVPWDNFLDAVVLLHKLNWTLNESLLSISRSRDDEQGGGERPSRP